MVPVGDKDSHVVTLDSRNKYQLLTKRANSTTAYIHEGMTDVMTEAQVQTWVAEEFANVQRLKGVALSAASIPSSTVTNARTFFANLKKGQPVKIDGTDYKFSVVTVGDHFIWVDELSHGLPTATTTIEANGRVLRNGELVS